MSPDAILLPKWAAPSSLKVNMWSFGRSMGWNETMMYWSFMTNPRASRSRIVPDQVIRPHNGTLQTSSCSVGQEPVGRSGSLHRHSTNSPNLSPLGISRQAPGNGAVHQERYMLRSSG